MTLPYLPEVWIPTDVEASCFLKRLEDLAPSVYGGRSDYEARTHVSDGVTVLTLSPRARCDAAGRFLFELTPDRHVIRRVRVEASISRETRPDYDEYTTTTRSLLNPLLKAYNKRYGETRKLHIQTRAQVTPKLTQDLAKLLRDFAADANKNFLNHHDWEHFYSFISISYHRNKYVAGEDLDYLLAQDGFGEYYREKLCMVFEHGWRLLAYENPEKERKRQLRQKERRSSGRQNGQLL